MAMKKITIPTNVARAQYHSISIGQTPSRSAIDWAYMSSIPTR